MTEFATVESYRDLEIWKAGMDLAVASYDATRSFPRDEIFGLTSQIRRSASSIPANIAEGYGRENTGSYIQSLRIAQGSLKEFETHIILAERVNLIAPQQAAPLIGAGDRLGKMIRSLIRTLQRKLQK